ncbi:MAG: hypothetical protein BM563_06950 [Bacteroidetes bacterium MedPE-SWsnd-G1]|nr:MAG: hypothetical protein BM563_06950 [Bacteroidetes bacterium MedPE-SWsnd-G1]
MKNKLTLIIVIVLLSATTFAQNVFMQRGYFKSNPSLEQVKKDIAAGNDPAEMNSGAFDPVVYAILDKVDNDIILHLLKQKGNDVNKNTHDGRTYAFWAALRSNFEVLEYLVANGADMNHIDDKGSPVMHFAAGTGVSDTRIYDLCIENNKEGIHQKNKYGANVLLYIASNLKDDTLIKYFTSKGIDIHSTDDNGDGIFNYAAKKINQDFLNLLIEMGVDYKSLNNIGGNAFINASNGIRIGINDLEDFKYLESLGLNPNVTTKNGVTPLHWAALRDKDGALITYFIEKGVDVNQADSNGNTAFINAASGNTLKNIALISKHNADVNTQNKEGQTALMKAVQRNSLEVIGYLLSNGADASIKDTEGNSLAHYLIAGYRSNNIVVFNQKLEVLKKIGLDFTEQQSKGDNLWHLAVKRNDMHLLETVQSLDVDINVKNADGLTPLHLAAMKATDTKALEYLIKYGADKSATTDFEESVYDLAQENELLQQTNTDLNFLK